MFKKLFLILFMGLLVSSVSGQVKISDLTNATAPHDSSMFVIVWDSSGTMTSRRIYWKDLVGAIDDNSTIEVNTAVDPPVIRLKDGGILAAKLATDAVETSKIEDLAVTSAKLAANAVVAGKINADAVEAGDIADDGVDETACLADSIVALWNFTTAAYDYIGTGGAITNNPDDVTLETKAGVTLGIREPVNDDIYMADDKKLYIGTGGDGYFEYDEDGNDVVQYSGVDQNWNGYYATQMQNIPDLASDGPGLWFDGSNDKVTMADNVHLDVGTNDFSIYALVKCSGGSGSRNIVGKGGVTTTGYQFFVNNSNYVSWNIKDAGGSSEYSGAKDLEDDKWHHLAMTADRDGNGILYIDGDKIKTQDISARSATLDGAGSFIMGVRAADGASDPWDGSMAKIYLFNLNLTTAEVKALQGSPIPYKYKGADQTERITDSDNTDFDDGSINEWTVSTDGNGTCAYDAGPGAVKTGKITVGATPGTYTMGILSTTDITAFVPGKNYRLTASVYLPSTNNNFTQVGFQTGNMTWVSVSNTNATLGTEDAWQTITRVYTVGVDVTGDIDIRGNSTTAADYFYIDNITITQIGCIGKWEAKDADGKNNKLHDSSGNGNDGTISGCKVVNPQTIIYTNKEEPDADEVLVSINKTVSGTQTTVFEMDEDGDIHIEGSGDATGPTIELDNANAFSGGARLRFTKDSASPADADILGSIQFRGDDSGGNPTTFAYIDGMSDDVTNGDEHGELTFDLIIDGIKREILAMTGNGGGVGLPYIIWNEAGLNLDYRWETDSESVALILDGGQTCLGLGTATFHANSVKNIVLKEGTAPGGATADQGYLWTQDDAGTAEMYVQDGAGNQTKISPHNDGGEWEFFSRNIVTGKVVQIDMESLVKEVEYLSGKTFLKETDMRLIEVSKRNAFEEYEEEIEIWKEVSKKEALDYTFHRKRVVLSQKIVDDSLIVVFDCDSVPVYQLNEKTGEVDTTYNVYYKTVLDPDSPKWTVGDDCRFDEKTGKFYEKRKQIHIKTKLKSGIWKKGNKYFRHETSTETELRMGR